MKNIYTSIDIDQYYRNNDKKWWSGAFSLLIIPLLAAGIYWATWREPHTLVNSITKQVAPSTQPNGLQLGVGGGPGKIITPSAVLNNKESKLDNGMIDGIGKNGISTYPNSY